jgi:hypothetical protein
MGNVLLCLAVFSLYDYAGYNMTRNSPDGLAAYRMTQIALQATLTAALAVGCSWKEAVAFNFLWWTWVADFAYYGWAHVLNVKGWENRTTNALARSPGGITWAWWTPVGIHFGGKTGRPIPVQVLLGQSCAAITICFILL